VLRRIFSNRERSMTSDLTNEVRRKLAEALGRCAHCGAALSGHEYALLAAEVLSDDSESSAVFFRAVEEHDWMTLRAYQRWEGGSDDAELYAVRCADKVSVVVLKTYFELAMPARVLHSEPLSAEEGSKLFEAFPKAEWLRFP
jgi:hypothetical protein